MYLPGTSEKSFFSISCYPFFYLFIGIFSIFYSKNINDLLFLIDNIEKSKITDTISPRIRTIPAQLLDIVAPKRLFFDLRIYKRVEFFSGKQHCIMITSCISYQIHLSQKYEIQTKLHRFALASRTPFFILLFKLALILNFCHFEFIHIFMLLDKA